ncbi:GGDEF domain-containing protein [Alcanivorax profundi]|uniref:GGDEF domain-containing protein n=1 Tax=Alcanivorax profundi TaxID=2338368 RepID=UPI0032B0FBDD
MFTLIPSNPPERAIRLRRQFMALYSYLLLWVGTFLGVQLSAFEPGTPHALIFGWLYGINALFYLMIRSGCSERLKDPSLTFLQMATGILATTAILYFSRELRGAMLSIYFMVMTFGVFALDRRGLMLMALFTLTCFTGLQVFELSTSPHSVVFSYLIGHWIILALGLCWFIYVGGYIHNLQTRVRDQRESLREAHERLSAIAIRDELTGLYNRRHFLERLDEEMSLAERNGSALHLAIIDLDHFKQVNDQYGHAAGDEVLCRFSNLASQGLRRSDLLARYGGEEFVVLFPHASKQACMAAMERLRDAFASQDFGFSGAMQTSFSAGLAAYQKGESAESFTHRADTALYEAKAAGRNRIHLTGE